MEHERKKVLVGMSGGIDSSAVCLMLQDEGYEVVGVTMRVWDLARQFTDAGQEYPDFIQDARALAARLGIVHYVADERKEGGSYHVLQDEVKHVDALRRLLLFRGGEEVPLSSVVALEVDGGALED